MLDVLILYMYITYYNTHTIHIFKLQYVCYTFLIFLVKDNEQSEECRDFLFSL